MLSKHPAETRMLLLITASGTLVLLCFFLIRLFHGETALALLDFYYFFGVLAGTIHIWRKGKTRRVNLFLMVLSFSAIIPIIFITGTREVSWLFPIMIASYYMLEPEEALGLNGLALVLCFPQFLSLWAGTDLLFCLSQLFLTNIFCFMFAKLIRIQRNQLEELASRYPLTGTGNRRALSENVESILLSQKRKKESASLISFDIDHFKSINDTYGHLAGDQILVSITETIRGRIRSTDQLYRQGGEEFIIVAMDTTRATAASLAEELRKLIEHTKLHDQRAVTISFGVAELSDGEDQHGWIKRVDSALYEAKMAGRNTVCVSA